MAFPLEPGPGADAAALGLIVHVVVSTVMIGPLLDVLRFRLAGGRTLLAWQPSWRVYRAALRQHGMRLPLDAAVVVTAGYGALLAAGGAPARVHLLFALMLIAALMPPLYWVSERGILILRPHVPWRRELSPWHFSWDEVQALSPGEGWVAVRIRPRWPGLPPHVRIIATEEVPPLLHAAHRIRPGLGEDPGEGEGKPPLSRSLSGDAVAGDTLDRHHPRG